MMTFNTMISLKNTTSVVLQWFNPLPADVQCRQQVKNVNKFFNIFLKFTFSCYIWIQHEKCIQMSTNKPSTGSMDLEIASVTSRKYCKFQLFAHWNCCRHVKHYRVYKRILVLTSTDQH